MLTIFALFPTASSAENSLKKVKAMGVAEEDITVLFEGNVSSEVLDRHRFTGERAAGVIAGGNRVAAALAKIGIPENLAVRYSAQIESRDSILVAVRFSETNQAEDARKIFGQDGGDFISLVGGALPVDAEPGDMRSESQLDAKLTGKLGEK